MKVIVKEGVVVPSFSNNPIPVGALFADDSEFLAEMDADCYREVHDERPPAPVARPVRKFGAKKGDR